MNSIMFMPRVIPNCSGGGNIAELSTVLLTFIIVGVILYLFGILANILHTKISQGFGYTPIYWNDIKPTIDNSLLGFLCGLFGFAFIFAALLMGSVAGIYWFIITL